MRDSGPTLADIHFLDKFHLLQVSADRHVEVSRWFGELVSVFYQHPASPHHHVFRVSNDAQQGCRNVGRTGWHIDGSFMEYPYSHSLYHMVSVPKSGDTGWYM